MVQLFVQLFGFGHNTCDLSFGARVQVLCSFDHLFLYPCKVVSRGGSYFPYILLNEIEMMF